MTIDEALLPFTSPERARYFEDYVAGEVHELGTVGIDEAEMLAFAAKYDPQKIHTDREFAKAGLFGGLIASGWQTAGLMMRLYAQNYLSEVSSIASPGMDSLRWPNPVRAGDTLSVSVEVIDARPSKSKPDRGIVKSFIVVRNQHGDIVMEIAGTNLILRRNRA
jgi:acyl dehydratase